MSNAIHYFKNAIHNKESLSFSFCGTATQPLFFISFLKRLVFFFVGIQEGDRGVAFAPFF